MSTLYMAPTLVMFSANHDQQPLKGPKKSSKTFQDSGLGHSKGIFYFQYLFILFSRKRTYTRT